MSTSSSRNLWWAVAIVAVIMVVALALTSPSSLTVAAQAPGTGTPGAVLGATALPPPPAALVPIPEGASPAEIALIHAGREYARRLGCLSCHSLAGQRLIGPSFRGLVGTELTLADGTVITVNEDYLRQAILDVHGAPVAGFPGLVMPDYSGVITDEQMDALVALLNALGTGAAAPMPGVTGTAMPGMTPEATAPMPGVTPEDTVPVPGMAPEATLPAEQALVIEGREHMQRLACFTCHTTNGQPLIGPTFLGLYGSTVTLSTGEQVVADEQYLRGSILAAHEQTVQNFPAGIMPDYSALVTPSQLDAMLAYLQVVGEAGEPVATPMPGMPVTPEATAEPGLAAVGRQVALQHGCFTCHTTTGRVLIGPSFRGLYGSTVTLDTGEQVVADEDYLRLSIIGAHAQTVEGFPGHVMPNYAGVLDEQQIDALIALIQSVAEPAPEMDATPMPGMTPEATATAEMPSRMGTPVAPEPALAQQGQERMQQLGCLTCHTTTGTPLIGPTFLGLHGSTVTLSDGTSVVADDEYLRRSIIAAHTETVEGFPPGLMPDYSALVTQEDLDALVAYLHTLGEGMEQAPAPTAAAPMPTEMPGMMVTPQAGVPDTASAQQGQQLVQEFGCLTCHTTNGQPLIGPTFLGLHGSTVTLSTGEQAMVDEEYLRRAILVAHYQAREGFPLGLMPDYAGIIDEQELDALVAYLATLGDGSMGMPMMTPEAGPTAMPMMTPETGPTAMATPEAGGATGPAEEGRQVALQMGCFTCHTSTGADLIGPTFQGLFGSTVTLDTGAQVVANEEYLRGAILAAHTETVEGFPPGVMPDYGSLLNEQQVLAIIEYLRSLT